VSSRDIHYTLQCDSIWGPRRRIGMGANVHHSEGVRKVFRPRFAGALFMCRRNTVESRSTLFLNVSEAISEFNKRSDSNALLPVTVFAIAELVVVRACKPSTRPRMPRLPIKPRSL
jgi:hypothetical protein